MANSPGAGSILHTHHECGRGERVWLARERNVTASAALHPYCVACGTVRNVAWPPAKQLGYYLSGLEALREYLDHAPLRPKLAQVQRHLITVQLAGRAEFEDPFGTPGQVQLDAYVDVIRSVRSDLDEELIVPLLPGLRGRHRMEAPQGTALSRSAPHSQY